MAINGKCGIFRMETNFIVYIFHGESFVTEVDGARKQPLLEGNNCFLLVC